MPTLPPVAGTQNAVVHAAAGGPSVADVGLKLNYPEAVAGGVITNLQSTFPFTQDTYLDHYMQPIADAVYGFGMEYTFDWEAHKKDKDMTNGTTPANGATFNTYRPGIMLPATVLEIIGVHDRRGFEYGEVSTPIMIVSDLSGTLERQKLRKDKVKLAYRQYEAP
ncbi:MAG: hypothetical protein E6R03_06680 [Hyphomicrobiaceae bacterium]|nr:MAG: hypothetical protein E6R03_06680 [Hyphomicrobiaceae bacterium]